MAQQEELPSLSLLIDFLHDLDADQIPDSMYAEELQLQEAIVASSTNSATTLTQRTPPPLSLSSKLQIGESSSSATVSQSLCKICAEHKDDREMFAVQNCTHNFCSVCISKHISIVIKKGNVALSPTLPCLGLDCNGVLEMEACREVLSKEVFEMWDDAVCEAMIEPSKRFYCPYKDCSGLLEKEEEPLNVIIMSAECPFCRRLMCARCNVPWHSGIGCEEFSRLGKEERGRADLVVHEMAKANKWQRCPQCKFYVEKSQGCMHIDCRCGFQFCYGCGKPWQTIHDCSQ